MSLQISIKNISASVLDFKETDVVGLEGEPLLIPSGIIAVGATAVCESPLYKVQVSKRLYNYVLNDEAELYIDGILKPKADVLSWYINLSADSSSSQSFAKATKHLDHTAFTPIGANQYTLDWSNILYDAFNLNFNISGGDPTGIYRVILPNTDSLSDGYKDTRKVYCREKLSGQQLNVIPASGADDARVNGSVATGTATGHIIVESDTVSVSIYRESAAARTIAFEQRGKNRMIAKRTIPISSAGFGNPSGNNMVGFNYTFNVEDAFAAASGQAWNVAGLEKKLLVGFGLTFITTSNRDWNSQAWLSCANSGEIEGSRALMGGSIDDIYQRMTSVTPFNWTQSDGNMVFKIYHQGVSGLYTNIEIILQEV